jgi:four helix bundle protein
MSPAKSFKDLLVWKRAHEFVLQTYKYSRAFPREELFCLTSQFRRASISIAANIAEGFVKRSPRDKIRILNIAQGSLEECRYFLTLCHNLGYGENQALEHKATEVSKLLNAYILAIDSRL